MKLSAVLILIILGLAACVSAQQDPQQLTSQVDKLTALVEQGQFRQELYHRLGVISLMLENYQSANTGGKDFLFSKQLFVTKTLTINP